MATVAVLNIASVVSAQQTTETRTIQISPSTAPANLSQDAATVDQFRDYLKLSGVGEIWRASWINAVDMNRSKGAPYWPASFWTDLKVEMRKTDLAPVVWQVYAGTFSRETMQDVNTTLRIEGVQGVTSSEAGRKFCADWAAKEESGRSAILALTQSTIQRVYDAHRAEIEAARAKYLKEHPGYKG